MDPGVPYFSQTPIQGVHQLKVWFEKHKKKRWVTGQCGPKKTLAFTADRHVTKKDIADVGM